MTNVRKIQYIGNQHLLNLPADFVKYAEWQKGDYLEVVPKEKNVIEVRKRAGKEAQRAEVILAALEQEAAELSAIINTAGINIDSGTYSKYSARFSHVAAKAWKLRQKISIQAQ